MIAFACVGCLGFATLGIATPAVALDSAASGNAASADNSTPDAQTPDAAARDAPARDAVALDAPAAPATPAAADAAARAGEDPGRGYVPVPRETLPPRADPPSAIADLPAAVLSRSMLPELAVLGAGLAAVTVVAVSTVLPWTKAGRWFRARRR